MSKSILKAALGKYVLVRSRSEGINAGKLVAADETGCVLKNARRLWYSKPADPKQAWNEGVANSGLHPESKVSPAVRHKYIIESYSIYECSAKAEKSIKKFPSHES